MQTSQLALDFRRNFPYFNNSDVCYLDNAATTHICQPALNAINHYYQFEHATVHRSNHTSATHNTNKFEQCRMQVAQHFGLADKKQVIWTKGATEAANIIAKGLCQNYLDEGDEVLLSEAEHHAHHVTWVEMAKQYKLKLVFIPYNENLQIDLVALQNLISAKTKVIAISHVSNATGVIQPIEQAIKISKQFQHIKVVVDGSQAVNHLTVDMAELNADFYFFSAHKMYSGTGLGVLLGQLNSLTLLSAPLYGGEMVRKVDYSNIEYNQLPFYLEAGTPNIAAVHAFSATLNFLSSVDTAALHQYQHQLMCYLKAQLQTIPFVQLLNGDQVSATSFVISGLHTADAAELLSQMKIAIRTGFHCAMPFVTKLANQGTLRVSIAPYNTVEEIDYFVQSIQKLETFLD
ncbi:SufS subfamily cysteine desulfurase [Catenovulum agarivorans DS-2]|uniref:SufS subfamily cysteine desulfurase n=1 Tax=Catenovulum agarivorans DS-2 TaxID=1328313 RepID=W7QK51_9ALTE|nr:aminotransferase class V-fold PLP-dependent enzyme [Catenovulum agarivorans]EWH12291.1 SufS subfamily cysteine desulfurase [Catenovulum agarivorans DS-2]